MLNALDELTRRHRDTGILVDTNMLLVYLVGLLDPALVDLVNPNRAYTSDDFELVEIVLGRFKRLVVTPAILSEVSNLSLSRLSQNRRDEFFVMLAKLLPSDQLAEQFAFLGGVTATNAFVPFGFADVTIESLAASGVPVFTDDTALYQYLAARQAQAFNYNYIRMLAS